MNKFRLQFLIIMVLSLMISTTAVSADTVYVIQRGDTLASIARRFGVTISQLVEANNIVNPNLIYANQQLIIPTNGSGPAVTPPASSGGTTTHVVSAGETMYRIALRYGVTVQTIVQANGISNPNVIYVGQSLVIPVSGNQPPQPTVQPTAVPVQPTTQPPAQPTAVPVQPTATSPQPTATSPQPTAAPLPTSTPVVIPIPNTGGNLLSNSSFEGGWYHPGNIPELQIPNSWRFEWDEGPTGFGNEVWDVWRRPEVRVLSRQYLPPEEHNLFIWNGNQTVKVFKGSAPISFRLLTDVTLQPGKYTLEIKVFPDLVVDYKNGQKVWAPDPLSGDVRLIAGNGSSGLLYPTFGQRNIYRHTFTVNQTQTITVGAAIRGRFAINNNGWFLDDWSLIKVE